MKFKAMVKVYVDKAQKTAHVWYRVITWRVDHREVTTLTTYMVNGRHKQL